MTLKIYADTKCTMQVKTIEWDSTIIIELFNGEKKQLPNTAQAGQEVKAFVFIRNEGKYPYGITKVTFPDTRMTISIEKDWLEPNTITRLTVAFTVPEKITEKDVVKAGKIEIEGYYIYGG